MSAGERPRPRHMPGRAEVLALADSCEAAEAARRLGVTVEEFTAMLDGYRPPQRGWEAVCNRTGRRLRASTWRRAYYLVCIHGLADWEIEPFEGGTA